MISLEKIQTGDQKFQFQCEHCDQVFNDWNLNISIFLYGVFFLSGSDRGVIGITCPKCLKDVGIEGPIKEVCRIGAKLLRGLQSGPNEVINQLAFFSSVNYHRKHNIDPDLDFCQYVPIRLDRDYEHPSLTELIYHEYNQSPWLETDDYSISLLEGQYHYFGSRIIVGWFKNDRIDKVINIENSKRIKLIDRYYYANPILTEINKFCWNFKYAEERYHDAVQAIQSLGFDDSDSSIDLDVSESSLHIYLDKPSQTDILNDFLEIVFSNHPPFTFPTELNLELDGLWKTIDPFCEMGMPQSIHHLEKNRFDKSEETKKLVELGHAVKATIPIETRNELLRQNAFQFIEEYETAFKRPDFSYAQLWGMKLRYADMLMDAFKHKSSISSLTPDKTSPATNDSPSRHSSQVKLKCREVAKLLWDTDPEITIADMCVRDEISKVAIQKSGELYKEGTIAKWIKDLCPNRKPGRRPKKD